MQENLHETDYIRSDREEEASDRRQNVHFQTHMVESLTYKNPPGHNAQEDCVIQAFEA